MILVAWRCPKL